MALVVNTLVVDNGLSLMTGVTAVFLCSDVPTTYAQATTGALVLGRANASFGAPQPATPKGRKSVSAAISTGATTGTGTAVVWAAVNESNSTLLANSNLAASVPVVTGRAFSLDPITITLVGEQQATAVALTATVFATSTPTLATPVLGQLGTIALTAVPLTPAAPTLAAAVINGITGTNFETFLTTAEAQNYGGASTPAQSFVTWGQAFRKGDIPTGMVPQCRYPDGTVVPAQFDLRSNWPDGSLKWCEVSTCVPAIATAQKQRVHIYRVIGTYNNSSVRVPGDVNAAGGHDFKIVLTTLTDDLGNAVGSVAGGTTTADFNTASAVSANTETVKQGPICRQWKTWMFFPGQQHLAAWFYVTAWTNPGTGALATISHIAKIHNGFLNVPGETRFFYSAEYKDGASSIRKWGANGTYEKQFTYFGSDNRLTCTAHGFTEGQMVTVRTTGTLPPGTTLPVTFDATTDICTPTSGVLSWRGFFTATGSMPGGVIANYPYSFQGSPSYVAPGNLYNFAQRADVISNGSGVIYHDELLDGEAHLPVVYFVQVLDADHIRLSVAPGMVGSYISITGNGTGNHFIVPKIFHQHHSEWFTADVDGRSDWIASEATVHVVHQREYIQSTNLLPPYDLDREYNAAVDSTPGYGYTTPNPRYSPLSINDMRPSVNDGGTHNSIGPIPAWCAMAFVTQDQRWATRARINALLQPQWSCWLNEATGKVPTVCGNASRGVSGNFSGLGTAKTTSYYYGGSNSRNVVIPAGGDPIFGSSNTPTEDFSHTPDAIHYTVLTEGGCHLIDSAITFGCGSIFNAPDDGFQSDWYVTTQRKKIANGNTYYGIMSLGQPRGVGWAWRSLSYARSITPDTWPEAAYMDFLMSNNAAYYVDRIAEMTANSNMTSMGWWNSTTIAYAPFMHAYMMRSAAFMAYLTENANMVTWADYMAKLFRSVADDWRGHTAGAFMSFGYQATKNSGQITDNRNSFVTAADFSFSPYIGIGSFDLIMIPDHTTDSFQLNFGGFNQTIFPIVINMILRFARGTAINDVLDPTLPDNFFFDTDYYVVSITGSEPSQVIKLSATPSGSPITFTSNGTCVRFYIANCADPVGMPSVGDALSPNNSAFQEAYGCLAEVAQYGVNVGTAYKKAYTLAREAETYAIPGVYEEFPNTPIWSIKPWYEAPGIIRFVDTNSWGTEPSTFIGEYDLAANYVGGDGTTQALTGPNAAYRSLNIAMRMGNHAKGVAANLTGTDGLTFWCRGGEDKCYLIKNYDGSGLPGYTEGTGTRNWARPIINSPGDGYAAYTLPPALRPDHQGYICTANDKLRFLGNPDALNGRYFGPEAFDVNRYNLVNRNVGAEFEPGGGPCIYTVQDHLIVDGIQFLLEPQGQDSAAIKFNSNGTGGRQTVRNCRFRCNANGTILNAGYSHSALAFQTLVGVPDFLIENNIFYMVPGGDSFSERAISFGSIANAGLITVINNIISGFPMGIYVFSGCNGIVLLRNDIIMNIIRTGFSPAPGVYTDASGGSFTATRDHNASDSDGSRPLGGSSSIVWSAGATDYNNNVQNYLAGIFAVKPGSALIGAASATGMPAKDIVGRPRATLTIGTWEP